MAGQLQIKTGTRLQIALDAGADKEPVFDLLCTFSKNIDDSAFLVSVPVKDAKALPLDEAQKLIFKYSEGNESRLIAGYADDEIKQGIRRYWKIRRVSEQRQFVQRADERIKVALKVQYTQPTWELNEDGSVEWDEGMTLDISGGGLALYLNRRFEVGEALEVELPVMAGMPEEIIPKTSPAVVCWQRETPKGSIYRLVCGLQFRFGDPEERSRMQEYVAYVKKRYRL
ncbi:MAG: PilZ domain-containing protein [Lachnospiraceae bacterium]|nr:PilZ domain-containing protein [Lachnospiraceae bacterium]